MNNNYDGMVHYMADETDTDTLDSKTDNSQNPDYKFDGFDVEINVKMALTPINVKPRL